MCVCVCVRVLQVCQLLRRVVRESLKLNSVALVRERTIPTERPPPVGEVSANFPWSSGQSFWLQIQRSRVRFPALPDFLSSSGSGTGSTQPREVN